MEQFRAYIQKHRSISYILGSVYKKLHADCKMGR